VTVYFDGVEQSDPTPSSYDLRLDDIAVSTRRVGGCGV
jgi:hypothetical protein